MSDLEMNKFFVSTDGEMFDGGPFDTREEAVKKTREEIHGQDLIDGIFYTGQLSIPHAEVIEMINTDSIIENLQENASDQYGETSEDWLSVVSVEQEKDLKNRIKQWLLDNKLEPNFGAIVNVEEHSPENKNA